MSRRRLIALAALGASALLSGCGSSEDFENRPRPAAPEDLTAKVNDRLVEVSPSRVGAGLVVITISNQSEVPVRLTLEGPTVVSDAPAEEVPASGQIPPNSVGNLKADLKQGEYEVSAGPQSRARPDTLKVGPPRPDSTNDLLLP